jgi:8-oxo-dGTP pyrophosphatase MutT (NUDIX family)
MKPRWSIVAVVSNDEDILAVARNFHPQDINLPGGNDVPEDKTPIETLRRLVPEQTGITIRSYHRMDTWRGEMRQPVYAFFIPKWSGKPRSSASGKTFWAKPRQLTSENATFAEFNKRLLKTLMRV